jgi:hypothetical protein
MDVHSSSAFHLPAGSLKHDWKGGVKCQCHGIKTRGMDILTRNPLFNIFPPAAFRLPLLLVVGGTIRCSSWS